MPDYGARQPSRYMIVTRFIALFLRPFKFRGRFVRRAADHPSSGESNSQKTGAPLVAPLPNGDWMTS